MALKAENRTRNNVTVEYLRGTAPEDSNVWLRDVSRIKIRPLWCQALNNPACPPPHPEQSLLQPCRGPGEGPEVTVCMIWRSARGLTIVHLLWQFGKRAVRTFSVSFASASAPQPAHVLWSLLNCEEGPGAEQGSDLQVLFGLPPLFASFAPDSGENDLNVLFCQSTYLISPIHGLNLSSMLGWPWAKL